MSEHKTSLQWKRETPDFQYDTYDRTHTVRFESGTTLTASAAPEFKGNAALVNPEEQFVAALSSCHMLTFLAVAARSRIVVDSYEDQAVGILAKGAENKLCMTKVTLRPRVKFADPTPTAEKIAHLHHVAHSQCFIANSVRTEVVVEHQP